MGDGIDKIFLQMIFIVMPSRRILRRFKKYKDDVIVYSVGKSSVPLADEIWAVIRHTACHSRYSAVYDKKTTSFCSKAISAEQLIMRIVTSSYERNDLERLT